MYRMDASYFQKDRFILALCWIGSCSSILLNPKEMYTHIFLTLYLKNHFCCCIYFNSGNPEAWSLACKAELEGVIVKIFWRRSKADWHPWGTLGQESLSLFAIQSLLQTSSNHHCLQTNNEILNLLVKELTIINCHTESLVLFSFSFVFSLSHELHYVMY